MVAISQDARINTSHLTSIIEFRRKLVSLPHLLEWTTNGGRIQYPPYRKTGAGRAQSSPSVAAFYAVAASVASLVDLKYWGCLEI